MKYVIAIIGLLLIGVIVLGMMPYYILKIVAGLVAILIVGEIIMWCIGMGDK